MSEVSKEAWVHQHTLLWGEHEYPEDALLHVGTKNNFAGIKVPLHDVDAAWGYAERHRFTDVYVRVAPLRGREYGADERGGKADSLALPALWLDVDCRHGVHGAENLPTMRQAGRIVRAVLAPSLIVKTGGGVHCYWALDEPFDWTIGDNGEILRRWASLWRRSFGAKGLHVDAGVSRDVGRVMRMAGTLNGKFERAAPVTIHERDPFLSYDLDTIAAVAPRDVRDEVERAAATARRVGGGPIARKVNAAVPLKDVLSAVWGLTRLDGDRWSLPYPDATHNPTGSAQVWHDAKYGDSVTAFSDRLQALWGLPDEQHSLRAWDLLVTALGGDTSYAGLVAQALLTKPTDLIEVAAKYAAASTPA